MEDIQIINLLRFIPILLTAVSLLFVSKGVITFLSSQKHERRFLTKELQFLYDLVILLFVFYFTPIVLMSGPYKEKNFIYNFIDNNLLNLVPALIIGFVFTIIFNKKMDYYNSVEFLQQKDRKKGKKLNYGFLFYYLTSTFIYIAPLGSLYGLFIHTARNEFNEMLLTVVFLLSAVYLILIFPFIRAFNKIFRINTPATIILKNGDRIINAYVLYPTYKNKLLIGDSPDVYSCSKNIAINNENVEYIVFDVDYNNKRNIGYKENEIVIINNNKSDTRPHRKRKV